MSASRIFLSAEWRNLILLNYEVHPTLLRPWVPHGTELDQWNGKEFISLVGFQFLKTRVMGLPIPFHANFQEVNLRFYVRRETGGEVRRGVVFIREIVPRRAIACVARTFYNEKYVALPMDHKIETTNQEGVAATYRWKRNGLWNEMHFESQGSPELPHDQVTHPPWRVKFADVSAERGVMRLRGPPASAFLAEGSAVSVMRGRRL